VKHHEQREHWLDYADDKYDSTLISDTKATLSVLFLYLPLPVFWALFDQQVSMLIYAGFWQHVLFTADVTVCRKMMPLSQGLK
jgi:dipeptide/tripeptide permease